MSDSLTAIQTFVEVEPLGDDDPLEPTVVFELPIEVVASYHHVSGRAVENQLILPNSDSYVWFTAHPRPLPRTSLVLRLDVSEQLTGPFIQPRIGVTGFAEEGLEPGKRMTVGTAIDDEPLYTFIPVDAEEEDSIITAQGETLFLRLANVTTAVKPALLITRRLTAREALAAIIEHYDIPAPGFATKQVLDFIPEIMIWTPSGPFPLTMEALVVRPEQTQETLLNLLTRLFGAIPDYYYRPNERDELVVIAPHWAQGLLNLGTRSRPTQLIFENDYTVSTPWESSFAKVNISVVVVGERELTLIRNHEVTQERTLLEPLPDGSGLVVQIEGNLLKVIIAGPVSGATYEVFGKITGQRARPRPIVLNNNDLIGSVRTRIDRAAVRNVATVRSREYVFQSSQEIFPDAWIRSGPDHDSLVDNDLPPPELETGIRLGSGAFWPLLDDITLAPNENAAVLLHIHGWGRRAVTGPFEPPAEKLMDQEEWVVLPRETPIFKIWQMSISGTPARLDMTFYWRDFPAAGHTNPGIYVLFSADTTGVNHIGTQYHYLFLVQMKGYGKALVESSDEIVATYGQVDLRRASSAQFDELDSVAQSHLLYGSRDENLDLSPYALTLPVAQDVARGIVARNLNPARIYSVNQAPPYKVRPTNIGQRVRISDTGIEGLLIGVNYSYDRARPNDALSNCELIIKDEVSDPIILPEDLKPIEQSEPDPGGDPDPDPLPDPGDPGDPGPTGPGPEDYPVIPGAVPLHITDNWAQKVSQHPEGTVFILDSGIYRGFTIRPKSNMHFLGRLKAQGETILLGTKILTDATPVSVRGVDGTTRTLYRFTGQIQRIGFAHPPAEFMIQGQVIDQLNEELFVDGVRQRRRATKEQITGPRQWSFYALDGTNNNNTEIYMSENPAGKTVETTIQEWAFRAEGTQGVKIENMVIARYGSRAQEGAIYGFGTRNWQVKYVDLHSHHGAGLSVGPGMLFKGIRVWNCGQCGIVGPSQNDTGNVFFEGYNWECYGNGELGFHPMWENGQTKFRHVLNGCILEDFWIHDGKYDGLWFDIDCYSVQCRRFIVERCGDNGVHFEISGKAGMVSVFEHFISRHNGKDWIPWQDTGSGFYVSNAGYVRIRHGAVYNNVIGVRLKNDIDRNRGRTDRLVIDVQVTNMDIQMPSYWSGFTVTDRRNLASTAERMAYYNSSIVFNNNTYRTDLSERRWLWALALRFRNDWQSFGLDADSEFLGVGTTPVLPASAFQVKSMLRGPR